MVIAFELASSSMVRTDQPDGFHAQSNELAVQETGKRRKGLHTDPGLGWVTFLLISLPVALTTISLAALSRALVDFVWVSL